MPMHEPIDGWTLLLAGITTLVQLGVWITIIVLAAIHYRAFPRHWRLGLLVALLLLGLAIPLTAFELFYYEPDVADDVLPPAALRTIHVGGTLIQVLLGVGWGFVVCCAGVWMWEQARPAAVPLLARRGAPTGRAWTPIAIGGAIGAGYGIVSGGALLWLEVGESELIRTMLVHYPGLEDAPVLVPLAIGLIVGVGAAIVEELEFRGVLLGFFARISGNHAGAVWAAIIGTSLVFASLHLLNTDAPGVKFVQIFIFSLIAGELVRRWSLESAIAAHLGLNVFAVMIDALVRW